MNNQPYTPPPKNPGQSMGIASMVLGICSLVIPFAGIATALVGLIMGVIAKKKSSEANMPSGMATAGIVCSIITLAVSVLCVFTCWIPAFCTGAALLDGLNYLY